MLLSSCFFFFFFSSRRRHTRCLSDWSSDVCSSDLKFVEKEPPTTWNLSSAREYGFYSNVNPAVDHPRWSQASERRLGEFLKRKTLMFNGYGDQVASLYAGMDLRKNY